MSFLPYASHLFSDVSLVLGKPVVAGDATAPDFDVDEACSWLGCVGDFFRSADQDQRCAFPAHSTIFVLGGELFFRPEDLHRIVNAAAGNGLSTLLSTTGAWVTDRDAVAIALQSLKGKISGLVVYIAKALTERIGVERIEMMIDEARKMRLSVTLRCFVSQDAPIPREIFDLEAFNAATCLIDIVPIADLAMRGPAPGEEAYFLPNPPLHRRCAEAFAFVIAPGGDVYPCYRGLNEPALTLGSLRNEPMSVIVARALGNQALRKLRDAGPRYLYDAARQSDAAIRLYTGYIDSCHFHCHALRDAELSRVVARAEASLTKTIPCDG